MADNDGPVAGTTVVSWLGRLARAPAIGVIAGVAYWTIAVGLFQFLPFFPAFFQAVGLASGIAVALFALELHSPRRAEVATSPELREHIVLLGWLLYWVTLVILLFTLSAAVTILVLGIRDGGTLVVSIEVPVSTIYFLILMSRYSTRAFSHDVRAPLRDLQTHIAKMDLQSQELNRLVSRMAEATGRLADAADQLVSLEKSSPIRKRMEVEATLPRLWFRAYSTSTVDVAIEIENRGVAAELLAVLVDLRGVRFSPVGIPATIGAGKRVSFQAARLTKSDRAIQVAIGCRARAVGSPTESLQSASFSCTLLKSGFWGTPQGVDVRPAEACDGLLGRAA